MGTGSVSMTKGDWKEKRNDQRRGPLGTMGHEIGESLKVAWALVVLVISGLFALITAILIAWPALAYIASRFFD